jgi:hypothetical protein
MFREIAKSVLGVLADIVRDPHLKSRDRFTIAAVTKLFPSAVNAVAIVRPETVVRWHRSLWRLLWRHRSRRPVGRPPIDADTRSLIRRMWKENPFWGEDVIAGELAKLGHHVSPRTVAKYRPAHLSRGRGQKWSTFIRNSTSTGSRLPLAAPGPEPPATVTHPSLRPYPLARTHAPDPAHRRRDLSAVRGQDEAHRARAGPRRHRALPAPPGPAHRSTVHGCPCGT